MPTTAVALPALTQLEQILWADELQGHALDVQIMSHFRTQLREVGVLSSWEVKETTASSDQHLQCGFAASRLRVYLKSPVW